MCVCVCACCSFVVCCLLLVVCCSFLIFLFTLYLLFSVRIIRLHRVFVRCTNDRKVKSIYSKRTSANHTINVASVDADADKKNNTLQHHCHYCMHRVVTGVRRMRYKMRDRTRFLIKGKVVVYTLGGVRKDWESRVGYSSQ